MFFVWGGQVLYREISRSHGIEVIYGNKIGRERERERERERHRERERERYIYIYMGFIRHMGISHAFWKMESSTVAFANVVAYLYKDDVDVMLQIIQLCFSHILC